MPSCRLSYYIDTEQDIQATICVFKKVFQSHAGSRPAQAVMPFLAAVSFAQGHCVGQVIGAILAESPAIAEKAAKFVTVRYEELPAVMTIEDAIAAER